jgi:hypothetical protein
MKTRTILLVQFLSLVQAASAQEHLIPDSSVLVEPDGYLLKVSRVFTQAFEDRVSLRAIVFPSFEKEYAVGIQETRKGETEVFVLSPSSQISDTEILKEYEEGKVRSYVNGKPVALQDDQNYQQLKKTTPDDYRKIKVTRRARPIPKDLADRVTALWHERLLEVRHPADLDLGTDGETYYLSAWVQGRGQLSGHIWSPDPDLRTGRLAAVVTSLSDYSKGKADPTRLTEVVSKATKP